MKINFQKHNKIICYRYIYIADKRLMYSTCISNPVSALWGALLSTALNINPTQADCAARRGRKPAVGLGERGLSAATD